ncbi:MAG TPA: hypothetical protein VJ783_00020 [Pirellulales bacterium]|nr:hypothetical protein [Pirellulales bacterium]
MLLFAATNALSYFVRSELPSLLGGADGSDRIGFPWMIWEAGGFVGRESMDYSALSKDIAVGIAISLIAGIGFAAISLRAGSATSAPIEVSASPSKRLQFSTRDLFGLTTAAAVILGVVRLVGEDLKFWLLQLDFWFGPAVILGVAHQTRAIAETQRTIIVSDTAIFLRLAAVAVGVSYGFRDFTNVLLGLFVFWTPQCVLAIGAVVAWRWIRARA